MKHEAYTISCKNLKKKNGEPIGWLFRFRRSMRWLGTRKNKCPVCGERVGMTHNGKVMLSKGHDANAYRGGLARSKFFGRSQPFYVGESA